MRYWFILFVVLFSISGLFHAFDENRDNHIDFKEISCGLSACCRGPVAERQKCKTSCSLKWSQMNKPRGHTQVLFIATIASSVAVTELWNMFSEGVWFHMPSALPMELEITSEMETRGITNTKCSWVVLFFAGQKPVTCLSHPSFPSFSLLQSVRCGPWWGFVSRWAPWNGGGLAGGVEGQSHRHTSCKSWDVHVNLLVFCFFFLFSHHSTSKC